MPVAARDYRYRWDPGVKVAEESLQEELGREDAEALVELVCEALDVPEPEVRWNLRRNGGLYVWGLHEPMERNGGLYIWGLHEPIDRRCYRQAPVIRLPRWGYTTVGTVLHEVAHHVHAFRSPETAVVDYHGPAFLRVFREVLGLWTEVPQLPAYKPRRFTKKLAAELVAKHLGRDLRVEEVDRGRGTYRGVLCNDGLWYTFKCVYNAEKGCEEWMPA